MSPKQIKSKLEKIKNKEIDLQKKRKIIQELCPHVNLTYENFGSSGSWDREDSYWRFWSCKDCGERWRSDQSYQYKKQFPHAVEIKKW